MGNAAMGSGDGEPGPDRPEQPRNRRLLTGVLVAILAVGGGLVLRDRASSGVPFDPLTLDNLTVLSVTAAIAAALVLNLSGRYRAAVLLTLSATVAAVVCLAVPNPDPADLQRLQYLVVPVLFSNLLAPLSVTVAFAAVSGAAAAVFFLAYLPLGWAVVPFPQLLAVMALVILASRHRMLLEKDRGRALAESEARFRTIVSSAPEAMLVWDSGRDLLVEANRSAEEIFDAAAGSLRGASLRGEAVWAPAGNGDALTRLREGLAAALRGPVEPFEVALLGRGGASRSCEARPARLPGTDLVCASLIDLTGRKRTEAQLRHMATHDDLTGLPNRSLFADRLSGAIARARRSGGVLAVLQLDLDDFKTVNDALDHTRGDLLLMETASRLRACLRGSDTVARRGGDDFSLLAEGLPDALAAVPVLEKVAAVFSAAFRIGGREVYVTASVGVSVFPADGEDPETLLQNAETALYNAKAEGKNGWKFFSAGMSRRAAERLAVATALRFAAERGELALHWQPQVDAHDGKVVGAEALLRWSRAGRLLPPGEFLPVAEETGLIVPVGRWALETACRSLAAWLAAGLPPLRISVNLSGRQLRGGLILEDLDRALAASGIPPVLLELELTENILFQDVDASARLLEDVKKRGVSLAVDDFGNGYSTLGQLTRIPLDTLKLDKRFTAGLETDPRAAAVAEGIVAIGRKLGMTTVAEGVETALQAQRYASFGCTLIQGYHFAKPMPAEELAKILAAGGRIGPGRS